MKNKYFNYIFMLTSIFFIGITNTFADGEVTYYKVSESFISSNVIVYFLIFGLVVLLITSFIPVGMFDKKPKSKYSDMSKKRLAGLLPGENIEKIKDLAYQQFVSIENAWMNFDYDVLEKSCVDYLYKEYKNKLKNMKANNEQNIVKDFKLFDYYLTNVEKIDDDTVITVVFDLNYNDYVINSKSGEIIRGKTRKNKTVYYECKYIYSGTKRRVIKCPYCGCKLDKKDTTKCKECGGEIDIINSCLKLTYKSIVK